MASNNAMTTAPPVTQATMLKRTHEIQCGKCAISDYAENIGVWNDDGTLQELGLCGECEEKYPICEICADECVDYDDKLCHGCYHKSVGADECWCASAVDACLTDRARDALKRFAEKKEILGQCQCCECDVTTEQDYLKLKTGPGAGRIYCEEHVGWGECQKAWSGSCGCDVCADEEENEDDIVGCCEKCDMEIVRDSEDHDNCLIIDGGDSADKFYCQSCGDMKTCEHCEGAVSDEGGIILVMGQEMTICESCDKGGDCYDGFLDEYHYNAETNDYEEKKEEEYICDCSVCGERLYACGSVELAEDADGGGCCAGCAPEEEATTEFARNKICDECGCKGGCELTCVYVCGEDSDEVKQYKAVLAETLRYEAIMDMMKK